MADDDKNRVEDDDEQGKPADPAPQTDPVPTEPGDVEDPGKAHG